MYLILDYIWTKVRKDIKRRLLIVDEAWYMMKHPDSAQFLNSIAKRARKYYLGVTTITQDVEDFLSIDLGETIIQNSSLQILLKQSSAAIDKVADVFYLSEGEKHLLLSADVGEGLFFAGPAHAAVRTIASPTEHELITTKPQEIQAKKIQIKPPPISIDSPATASVVTQPPIVSQKPVQSAITIPNIPNPSAGQATSFQTPPPTIPKDTPDDTLLKQIQSTAKPDPNRPMFTVETVDDQNQVKSK
jgi:hypothetical protein